MNSWPIVRRSWLAGLCLFVHGDTAEWSRTYGHNRVVKMVPMAYTTPSWGSLRTIYELLSDTFGQLDLFDG